MRIPELEARCGSWICTGPAGQVVELFTESNPQRALDAGWKVETAMTYLGRVNAEIRANGGTPPQSVH